MQGSRGTAAPCPYRDRARTVTRWVRQGFGRCRSVGAGTGACPYKGSARGSHGMSTSGTRQVQNPLPRTPASTPAPAPATPPACTNYPAHNTHPLRARTKGDATNLAQTRPTPVFPPQQAPPSYFLSFSDGVPSTPARSANNRCNCRRCSTVNTSCISRCSCSRNAFI
jgi:hypothetical protein